MYTHATQASLRDWMNFVDTGRYITIPTQEQGKRHARLLNIVLRIKETKNVCSKL